MFARKSGTVFLDPHFKEVVLTAAGADNLTQLEVIQELWSGYGHIVRYALTGSELGV